MTAVTAAIITLAPILALLLLVFGLAWAFDPRKGNRQ